MAGRSRESTRDDRVKVEHQITCLAWRPMESTVSVLFAVISIPLATKQVSATSMSQSSQHLRTILEILVLPRTGKSMIDTPTRSSWITITRSLRLSPMFRARRLARFRGPRSFSRSGAAFERGIEGVPLAGIVRMWDAAEGTVASAMMRRRIRVARAYNFVRYGNARPRAKKLTTRDYVQTQRTTREIMAFIMDAMVAMVAVAVAYACGLCTPGRREGARLFRDAAMACWLACADAIAYAQVVLAVRQVARQVASRARGPASLAGWPKIIAAHAYRSLIVPESGWVQTDLGDARHFDGAKASVISSELSSGTMSPLCVEDMTFSLYSYLRVLDSSAPFECIVTGETFHVEMCIESVPPILYEVLSLSGGDRMHLKGRPRAHARLLSVVWKGLFARGRTLYLSQAEAQVTLWATGGDPEKRRLVMDTLMDRLPDVRPWTLDRVCAAAIVFDGELMDRYEQTFCRIGDLRGALSRFILTDARIKAIKERLWRPEGALAARFMTDAVHA